jgi:maltose alpha-D-glucosyltransferase/alpha-amylase
LRFISSTRSDGGMAKKRTSASHDVAAELLLPIESDWYKDAVIYQLHVRSFHDSDGDGVGDFAGLTAKLDYLQDLGVTALWLLPFYPSPLRDDGYDIASYCEVNPAYGDLRAFKSFVREAHARGLRVITELVLNHTSDQHPWFQRARRAKPGSADRNFYVWSESPEGYRDARIIFKDFESSNWSWDPIAKAYYWHRFYSHQPDLNFDSERVRRAMFETVDYWLRLGVDGLRLDAVPYLYEREGTNCENLPETHAFLRSLRSHVDQLYPGRMLLAEANQWPEDAIAYFGDGDECHTAFHFPVMPRLFMSLHMEDRFPVVDILRQTPPIPQHCQWMIFLRNHDELTLEMVTDEERDYMYRVYARDRQARINLGIRRRLAPLLENDRRRIELLNGLLFALPGTPVIYYGDEIGMGDNIYLGDRHGVRTPMQWSPDRNAGFSSASPQRLYSPVIIEPEYLFETVNVETQQKNPHSLLWWMKRLIALRQRYPALGRGGLEILAPDNSKILAFIREHQGQSVLMVANLSRFVQFVELDLSRFAGARPMEVFGHTRFPPVTRAPYVLTLSPYAFYWLALAPEPAPTSTSEPTVPAKLTIPPGPIAAIRGRLRKQLETVLLSELPRRRWFDHRQRPIEGLQIVETIPLGKASAPHAPRLTLLRVESLEADAEMYLLPLGIAWGPTAERVAESSPETILAQLQRSSTKESGVLFDATLDPVVARLLFGMMARRRQIRGHDGHLACWSNGDLADDAVSTEEQLALIAPRAQPSEHSVVLGERWIVTPSRRMESGENPDIEISRFLTRAEIDFPHISPVAGAVEYRRDDGDAYTLAFAQRYIPNSVTAWQYVQDALGRYFEYVIAQPPEGLPTASGAPDSLWDLAAGPVPVLAQDLLGGFLEWVSLLGRRSGELHTALASDAGDSAFAPEAFTQLFQRSLYQSARKLALQALHQLKAQLTSLSVEVQVVAGQVLDHERQLLERFRTIEGQKINTMRIRCHGNYHLGQVLYTGKDFLIAGLDANPARSAAARRIKSSALRDVASMIHSFHYAASAALWRLQKIGPVNPDTLAIWRNAADFWSTWTSSAFLRAYANACPPSLLPPDRAQRDALLRVHLMEQAVLELQFELKNMPERAGVPLAGMLDVLKP